jgi:integrase
MSRFHSAFAPLIQNFIKFCGGSNRIYGVNLSLFDRYCATTYPKHEELTQDMVTSWCRKRDSETNNSCRARISVIVSFVNYLRKRGITNVSPPELPRMERCTYIPHSFTRDELKRFFLECDNITLHTQRMADRKRKITLPVFFRFLYSSGIRTNEARTLRRNDIDLETGVISICSSKGDNQHYIVLHDSMLEIMRIYDRAIEKLHPNRTYFFPAKNDGCYTGCWLSSNFRQLWFSANKSQATPYDLRHNYAIENINSWLNEGFDFFDRFVYLGKSMGHKKAESTKYYYSLVPAMANILRDISEDGFNEIIPEVYENEEE